MADDTKSSYQYPISYDGNVAWPILALILFFPVGIVLLILYTKVRIEGTSYSLKYRGDTFWLIFWTIVFFPVAIILAAIKGFDLEGQKLIP